MEQTLYLQELMNDCKTKAEDDFKSRENRLLGLQAERERQRLKFVEEMRVQQLMLVYFVALRSDVLTVYQKHLETVAMKFDHISDKNCKTNVRIVSYYRLKIII